MKRVIILLLTTLCTYCSWGKGSEAYSNAFDTLKSLIESNQQKSFKKAVFIVENTYLKNEVDYNDLNKAYDLLSDLAVNWAKNNHIDNYDASDADQMVLNRAVFQVIKDTIRIQTAEKLITFSPFVYNFDDYNGKQDWTNTFVTTLLATHKGNCHSLPYLYKIIADEIGAKCWLALAPNHMYIKNRSVRDGWFNTELTSGDFPIDAWLTTTGYIPLRAIQTGLYCDTLGNQQSIALCVLDLAKAYEKETKNYYDGFILQCCDLVLKYHSTNVQALLLKAETLKHIYQQQTKEGNSEAKITYNDMEGLYVHLYDMGYREMPDKMYQEWLLSLKNQKDKYSNQKVSK
ncbi:MAG: hypothetical protein WC756_15515 [Taibaiella sp.]|jgi:hypothetical protein